MNTKNIAVYPLEQQILVHSCAFCEIFSKFWDDQAGNWQNHFKKWPCYAGDDYISYI